MGSPAFPQYILYNGIRYRFKNAKRGGDRKGEYKPVVNGGAKNITLNWLEATKCAEK